jgi:hypothetical protein
VYGLISFSMKLETVSRIAWWSLFKIIPFYNR